MLAMTVVTMATMAVMVLFPETGAARFLRHWLIEAPARALNRTAVWRIAFFSALIAAGLLMTILFETEGLLVYGMMAPEIAVWAALFDVGLVIDAFLITTAILAGNGFRVVKTQIETLGRRVAAWRAKGSRSRAPRARRPARPGRKSDDDRPAWAAQPSYRAFSMA